MIIIFIIFDIIYDSMIIIICIIQFLCFNYLFDKIILFINNVSYKVNNVYCLLEFYYFQIIFPFLRQKKYFCVFRKNVFSFLFFNNINLTFFKKIVYKTKFIKKCYKMKLFENFNFSSLFLEE